MAVIGSKMINNVHTWEGLQGITTDYVHDVPLEQDFTVDTYTTNTSMKKLREIQVLDEVITTPLKT